MPKISSHLLRRRGNKSEQVSLNTITDNITMGNKIVVYKKAKRFDEDMYIVEISKSVTDDNKQTIFLYPLFGNKQFHLSIPVNVYGDVEMDPERIVNGLKLKGDNLTCIPCNRRCSKISSNISITQKIVDDDSLDLK